MKGITSNDHARRGCPCKPFGTAVRERLFGIWNDRSRTLPDSAVTFLLSAASGVYQLGLQRSQAQAWKRRVTLPAFVVSIGNIVTGGTGKTPVALFACKLLKEEGLSPAILSRGYKRKGKGPARVFADGDPSAQSEIYGDEPVLMATALPMVPVWVGRERAASGLAALGCDSGVDTLILDDGFQHLRLERDLDIVLLDSVNPFGNGFTLPLGPLREPLTHLERADALVITRADSGAHLEKTLSIVRGRFPEKPVFACRHVIRAFRSSAGGPALSVDQFKDRRVVAFAGIAEPEKFFDSLSALGIHVCRTFAFPDHSRYRDSDFVKILGAASECVSGIILTTAKDAVKVPAAFRKAVTVAELDIDFGADDVMFRKFVRERIRTFRKEQQG